MRETFCMQCSPAMRDTVSQNITRYFGDTKKKDSTTVAFEYSSSNELSYIRVDADNLIRKIDGNLPNHTKCN